jgi:predicted glycosyltransferase
VRVWVDLTNTAHPVILRPLVEALHARGDEVEMTARPLSHTVALLEDWGHPFTLLGAHGGASRTGKARAAADRVAKMIAFGHGRRFDAALAHGSTDLPVAARLLRIPNTTMFDYEWATLQHSVNCRLADRVLVPDAIPAQRLRRYGATARKLVRYPGLKEEYYLSGFEPDLGLAAALGAEPGLLLAVVRTAPAYALYLGGSENALLPRLLERLNADERTATIVLVRTPEQAQQIRGLGLERLVIPERAVDARSLIAAADVLVSAGGTMNREAAVLGTPVWSMFEGRPGAVDDRLVADGRLKLLGAPEDVVMAARPRPPVERFAGRDPGVLLDLALDQLVRQ